MVFVPRKEVIPLTYADVAVLDPERWSQLRLNGQLQPSRLALPGRGIPQAYSAENL